MAQLVKNLPAMWEIRVLSLGWEEPLKKRMATHKESDTTERLSLHFTSHLGSIFFSGCLGGNEELRVF